ncbi:MAG: glucokinase, partial [Actinomycetota bacterium]
MKILVGDIGGTNARFAVMSAVPEGKQQTVGGRFELLGEGRLPSERFPSLEDAISAFIDECPAARTIERACFGIAGPIRHGRCETTNLPWVIDSREVAMRLGLDAAPLHLGLAHWKAVIEDFRKAFTHVKVTSCMQIAEGDKVATHVSLSAVHSGTFINETPTNNTIRWDSVE